MTIFAKRFSSATLLILCLSFVSSSVLSAASAPLATPIAAVNIQDAKIVSQSGNVFSVSFKVSNREGQQSGVKYGVKLVSQTAKGQFIVDEKVYDESLYLAENTTIERTITYEAPEQLSGKYALVLYSSNVGGFPFGINYVGDITLSSTTKGVIIIPESCVLQVEGEKGTPQYALLRGIDITSAEILQLRCTVSNETSATISVSPSFETREGSSYGEVISQTNGSTELITLSANEKKTVTINLPKGPVPKAYNVKTILGGEGNISNSIAAQYLIVGTSATIQNITLDKDYTKQGEEAVIGLIWSASVPNIPGSRTPFDPQMTAVYADVTIKNKLGMQCIAPFTEIIEVNPSTPRTDLKIIGKQACKDPKVAITLKDQNNTILDQGEATFETTQQEGASKTKSIVAIIVIIAIAALLINRAMKKKDDVGAGANTTLLLFGIIALSSFIPLHRVHADTFYIGTYNYAYATVNINSSTYAPGAPISVTGTVTSAVGGGYSVDSSGLTATTTGTPTPVTVIGASTIAGGNTVFGSTSLVAPSTPGSYNTTFSAGIDEYAPVNQPTVLVDFDSSALVNINYYGEADQWDEYNNPTQHHSWSDAWYDGDICLSQSRTTDTDVRYVHYGTWNNVPLDWNGFNYVDFIIPAGQTCVDGDILMNTINTCQLDGSNPTGGCFALGESIGPGAPGPIGITTWTPYDFGCLIPQTSNVGAATGAECWDGDNSGASWHNANVCPGGSEGVGGMPFYVVPQGETVVGDECHSLSIPPSDICPNLSGNQTTMPIGFIYDLYGEGDCVAGPKILGSSRLFDSAPVPPYESIACSSHISRGYGLDFPYGHIDFGQTIYSNLAATQPVNGQNKWMKVADSVRAPGSYAIKIDSSGMITERVICD